MRGGRGYLFGDFGGGFIAICDIFSGLDGVAGLICLRGYLRGIEELGTLDRVEDLSEHCEGDAGDECGDAVGVDGRGHLLEEGLICELLGTVCGVAFFQRDFHGLLVCQTAGDECVLSELR